MCKNCVDMFEVIGFVEIGFDLFVREQGGDVFIGFEVFDQFVFFILGFYVIVLNQVIVVFVGGVSLGEGEQNMLGIMDVVIGFQIFVVVIFMYDQFFDYVGGLVQGKVEMDIGVWVDIVFYGGV